MKRYKKVWIYCRVAYPDAAALESQKQRLLAAAERQGFEVVGVTAETGAGSSVKRHGMDEILSAAKGRKMDALFLVDSSRITRNAEEFLDCIDDLSEYGVEVLTLHSAAADWPRAGYAIVAAGMREYVNQ